jgi:predicted MFS family arabinose efflux permease
VSVLSDAGQQSALPRLVDRRVLTSANARLEQAGAVARTSGPLLGGLLVRVLGAPFALLADALSYLASGLLLASIRVTEPDPPAREQRHLGRELREGLAWVYRHSMLAPVAVWGHVWFVFNAMLGTIFVPYALRDLGLSALGLGVAYACAGVGAVVGGALARRAAERLGLGPAVILAQWLTPAAFALIALARPGEWPLILVGAGQALFGVGIGLSSPNTLGFRQAITPDALQGRMNATIRSLNWGMIAIGAPLGGMLADQLGFRPALWIGVAGFAVASAGLLLSPFRRATAPH